MLLEIRKHLQARGTRISDVISEFNPRRSSAMPVMQFERMLASIGVHFTNQELAILERDFETGNGMDVRSIINAVESTREVRPIVTGCDDALIEMSRKLAQRRQTLTELVRPFDRARQGTVTKIDFLRALDNSRENILVAEKFVRREDGLIHYQDVEEAMREALAAPPKPREAVPLCFDKIAAQLMDRNIDVHGMFNARDRFNAGALDEHLFGTALSSTGIQIAPEVLREIIDYYRRGQQIDYTRFIVDYNEFVKARRTQMSQSPRRDVRYDLGTIMQRLKADCASRRVRMADLFAGQNDNLSRYIFVRTLRSAGFRLEQGEVDFLAQQFERSYGVIDLPGFLAEFSDRQGYAGERRGVDSREVAAKVMEFLDKKQVALEPRLEKYDREGKGEIPVDLVGSALKILGLTLYPEELDALAGAFPAARRDFIRWHDFATAVDPIIQAPLPVEPEPTHERVVPRRRRDLPDDIITVLQEIDRQSRSQSFSLWDTFRMRDRTKSGVVSGQAFMTEMTMLFPRMSPAVLEKIVRFYGGREVNYYDFCDDIQRASDINVASREQTRREMNARLEPIIEKIKAYLVRQMLSSQEIFRSEDTQSVGWIRTDRVQHCFNVLRLQLTDHEIDVLIQRFQAVEFPGRFEYRELCAMVDAMYVDPRDVEWILQPDKAKTNYDILVNNTISMLKDKLSARRRRIDDVFESCRTARISDLDFMRRMENIGFVVSQEEIRALLWKYSDDRGFDWQRFCDEVTNAHLI